MAFAENGIAQNQHTVKRKLKIDECVFFPARQMGFFRRLAPVSGLVVNQTQTILRDGILDAVDSPLDIQSAELD